MYSKPERDGSVRRVQTQARFYKDGGATPANQKITSQSYLCRAGATIGAEQSYDWQVPVDMDTQKAKVRITVYDGASNSAAAESKKNFNVWPMPIINFAVYNEGEKPEFEVAGRNYRAAETEVWVDDVLLKKIQFQDKYLTGNGMYKRLSSFDKKLNKRVPRPHLGDCCGETSDDRSGITALEL